MLWLVLLHCHLLLAAAERLCVQSVITVTYFLQISHIYGHYEYENNSRSFHIKFLEVNRTYNSIDLLTTPARRKYVETRYRFARTPVQPKRNWRRILTDDKYRKYRKYIIPMIAKGTESRREGGGMAEVTTNSHLPAFLRMGPTPDLSRFSTVAGNKRLSRTPPFRKEFVEDCDYLSNYCFKAYNTGLVCGRTYYSNYFTFTDYCMLDYVNCMERYEIWRIAHLGPCFNISTRQESFYAVFDDYWLDQNVQEDHVKPWDN